MLLQKGDVLLLDKNLRNVRTVSVEEVFRGEASPVPCSVTDKTHSLCSAITLTGCAEPCRPSVR